MQPKYTTASGHTLDIDPTSADYAFLERLERESVRGSNAMITLAYSHENPFLDTTTHPSLGVVTKETLENPAYRAMTDILFRQKMVEAGVTLQELAAQHTVTVAEAAIKLGVHESAVRQAIAAQRLASWVKNGKHFLKPSAVEAFQRTSSITSKRGPAPAALRPGREPSREACFVVLIGTVPEGTLKIAGHRELTDEKRARGLIEGRVENTQALGIMSESKTDGATFRLVSLDPSERAQEVRLGSLFVTGRWRLLHVNNGRAARRAWGTWRALVREAENATREEGAALVSRFERIIAHAELLDALDVHTFEEVRVENLHLGSGSADPGVAARNADRNVSSAAAHRLVANSPKGSSGVTMEQYRALVSLGAIDETDFAKPKRK